MPDLKIGLSPIAHKQLTKLDTSLQGRVKKRLNELAANPADPRISAQLVGYATVRKSRVGTHRILFEVRQTNGEDLLAVIAIEHRKDVYRKL